MSKPTVIIPAAGENSRFFPFNADTHKGALTLHGQKLIERTLQNLADHGFEKVVIVVSPKDFAGQGLSGELKTEQFPGLQIDLMLLPEATGMGSVLLLAEEKVEDQFCAVFPYCLNAGEVLDQMLQLQHPVVIAASVTSQPVEYGALMVINNQATALIEKPTPEQATQAHHKIKGLYVLSRQILEILKTLPQTHYNFEDALHQAMQQTPIPVYELQSEIPSLKYPWHLFEYQALLFKSMTSQRAASAKIAETAVIDESQGPVYIGENVTVGHATKIIGPSYIGDNALVGDFSFVRQSSLEANVQVGANTEVVRSIIMSGSSAHFSYLADSIIGEKVKIGAGFITGNKRLDRQNVRTLVKEEMKDTGRRALGVVIGPQANLGIRVTTMPGVMIGSQATVYPGQILTKNAPHQAEIK